MEYTGKGEVLLRRFELRAPYAALGSAASQHGLLHYFMHPPNASTDQLNARQVSEWLEQRRLAIPEGAVKVRHLDCHDTYWRPSVFGSDTFGMEASKAIMAFLAFLDGGWMDYNGLSKEAQEFSHRLVALRKREPVLRNGDCDYLAWKLTTRWSLRRSGAGKDPICCR
ncbi:MAG TPA: hypothetical protein VGS41_18490 [Chthonomonadales bacterium]|nr:hypothetical protein [Chthonomonadales bacterium]